VLSGRSAAAVLPSAQRNSSTGSTRFDHRRRARASGMFSLEAGGTRFLNPLTLYDDDEWRRLDPITSSRTDDVGVDTDDVPR